jgi:hypothetical protein
VYIRRQRDQGPFFSWLDGLLCASSEFIHFTFDDDWIDKTFMESCLQHFDPECAFVFTAADLHLQDGRSIPVFDGMFSTGAHRRKKFETRLLGLRVGTISPGCAVFRRSDVLPAITIGKLPNSRFSYRGVGADMLMFLLPLLHYRKFAFIDQRLAHFRGHAGSITFDAENDPEKWAALNAAYRETKYYYLRLKAARLLPIGEAMYAYERVRLKIIGPFLRLMNRKKRLARKAQEKEL